jgi:hypothetical protein
MLRKSGNLKKGKHVLRVKRVGEGGERVGRGVKQERMYVYLFNSLILRKCVILAELRGCV